MRPSQQSPHRPGLRRWRRSAAPLTTALVAALTAAPTLADAPFGARVIVASDPVQPLRVFAVDVDHDGDLDLISINNTDRSFALHENNPAFPTGFAPRRVLTIFPDRMNDLTAADLDSDGKVDLLVALDATNQFMWLRNLGGSPIMFDPPLLISNAGVTPSSIGAADFDRDGDVDVLTTSVADDAVAWHENRGGSPIAWTTHLITFDPDGPGGFFEGAANAPQRAEAADVDRDGRVDIVVASSQDDTIQWFRNEGGSPILFTPQLTISTMVDQAVFVTMADLDSDGQPDALTVSNASGRVEWHENRDGFSTVLPSRPITTLFAPRWAATGDVDNDGDTDVVVAALTSSVVTLEESSGGPNPVFFERVVDSPASAANQAILGDFDNDGDLDVASVTLADDTISLRPNLLIHRTALLSPDLADSPPSGGAGAGALLAADLDRDSDTDLVVVDSATGDIRLLRSQGSLRLTPFLAPLTLATLPGADALAAADVDRDGDLDLIAAASSTGAVQVLLSDGGAPPAFAAPIALGNVLGVQALAAGDVDRDGDLDIVAAPTPQGDVVIFRNDGAGAFTASVVPSGAAGSGLALVDIDHDGDLDILTAGRPAPPTAQLRALLNDGSGVFSNQLLSSFAAASDRIALRPADVDNDGDLDLFLTSDQSDSVLLFESDGQTPPTFNMRTIASGLTEVHPLELADLDRDGDVDALVGSSWLENQGGASPAFAAHSGLTAPADAVAIAVADFDGEGDADAAYASPTQGAVSILRNIGGQASLSAVSVAPASIGDGAAAALLRVDATHEGRAGDADAHIQTLLFSLTNDTGSPLTQGQAALLFDRFQLYVDDGDGAFSQAQDALVADEPMQTLPLDPQGRFTLTATLSAQTRLAPSQTRSFFLVATTKAAASQQGFTGFRAVHPNDGADVLIDAIAASPLLLSQGAATQTPLVGFGQAPCPGDVTGDGAVGPDDLFALLGNWGNPFGPNDLFELLGNWGAVCN